LELETGGLAHEITRADEAEAALERLSDETATK
jgi:hypothetical protein